MGKKNIFFHSLHPLKFTNFPVNMVHAAFPPNSTENKHHRHYHSERCQQHFFELNSKNFLIFKNNSNRSAVGVKIGITQYLDAWEQVNPHLHPNKIHEVTVKVCFKQSWTKDFIRYDYNLLSVLIELWCNYAAGVNGDIMVRKTVDIY